MLENRFLKIDARKSKIEFLYLFLTNMGVSNVLSKYFFQISDNIVCKKVYEDNLLTNV